MPKCYKTIFICGMCKQRFTAVIEKGKSSYLSDKYCSSCISKYFPSKQNTKL